MPDSSLRGPLCNTSSLAILAFVLGGVTAAHAGALPGHGRFVAGHGAISKSGTVLTIDQNSATGIVDWRSFSIGKNHSVQFDNGKGATLNRVTGGDLSRIAGQLHGTGSVYLINNAGVAVLPTGRVVTQGSFAASSGNADGGSFGAHRRLLFTGGADGNVVNEGRITSVNGRVDLNGRNVIDSGVIAGRAVSAIASNAERVNGRITARGAIETSGARVSFAGARIAGRAWLVDPKDLTVNVANAGVIDKALDKGTNVTLVTTATGASGPGVQTNGAGNITIAAPLTWTGVATLTLNAHHSVIVNKKVEVEDKGALTMVTHTGGLLRFGAGGEATFDNLGAHLTINGEAYKLAANVTQLGNQIAANPNRDYALSSDYNAAPLGKLTASPIPTTFMGNFDGLGHTISNLKIEDTVSGDEVGLFSAFGGGASISNLKLANVNVFGGVSSDTGGLVGYTNNADIRSITVSGVVGGGNDSDVGGLVGYSSGGSIVSSSSSAAVKARNNSEVGGLVGDSGTPISNSDATGAVTDNEYDVDVGGLVGYSGAAIAGSTATGKVSATGYESEVGGLVGDSDSSVTTSSASGNVIGGSDEETGGLIGYASGAVSQSYATGSVTAGDDEEVGGLVGESNDTVSNSYATGAVSGGAASEIGGLIGDSDGMVTASYAKGAVSGGAGTEIGGLIGYSGNTITSSYATGAVTDNVYEPEIGGLVGYNSGAIISSYATGNVTANAYENEAGGLVGQNNNTITKSHATGNVHAAGLYGESGGLIGYNDNTVTLSYATGNVVGGAAAADGELGGFVGYNSGGSISRSYALGSVTGGADARTGGFAGESYNAALAEIYARGNVTAGSNGYVGGLVGEFYGAGTITQAYSTGAVKGGYDSEIGGLLGYDNTPSGSITYAYWDRTTSGITDPSQGAGSTSNDSGITGRSTALLTAKLPPGFSTTYWGHASSMNDGFPFLKGVGGQ
ncbi:MAG TPA: GLUG motif-containing protein [Rhizomicrobium sp.]|nr:GLUG motif-containing protein [Rhizomicrobium sp.]